MSRIQVGPVSLKANYFCANWAPGRWWNIWHLESTYVVVAQGYHTV